MTYNRQTLYNNHGYAYVGLYLRFLEMASEEGDSRMNVQHIVQSMSQQMETLNSILKQNQRRKIERGFHEAVMRTIKVDMKGKSKAQIVSIALDLFTVQKRLGNASDYSTDYTNFTARLHTFVVKNTTSISDLSNYLNSAQLNPTNAASLQTKFESLKSASHTRDDLLSLLRQAVQRPSPDKLIRSTTQDTDQLIVDLIEQATAEKDLEALCLPYIARLLQADAREALVPIIKDIEPTSIYLKALKNATLDEYNSKWFSNEMKGLNKDETNRLIKIVGYLQRSDNRFSMFRSLFRHFAFLKNKSLADIQCIEEYFRIHEMFFTKHFRYEEKCQGVFEDWIKVAGEQIVAFKLYSSELDPAASFGSL
jgi:hypothetical protein